MAVASAATHTPREGALVKNLRIVVLLVESNDPVPHSQFSSVLTFATPSLAIMPNRASIGRLADCARRGTGR
jgi:hypothetical protein